MTDSIFARHQSARYATLAIGIWLGALAATTRGQDRDYRPMELSQVSPSEAFDIKDGLELDPTTPIITRMLYRLRKASPQTIDEFSEYSRDLTWPEVQGNLIDHRFWLFNRSANVRWIEKIPLADAPSDADIQHVYVCYAIATPDSSESPDLQQETTEVPLTILCRTIPRGLPLETAMQEPIRFAGLLYCQTQQDSPIVRGSDLTLAANRLALIADSIGWYPDSTQLAPAGHVALASLGFDAGWFDTIRRYNAKGLRKEDAEAFFQFVAAVREADRQGGVGKISAPRATLPELLQAPGENLGAAVQFSAVCRECTLTKVPYPDIQKRLGLDHYYQLAMFPDLGQDVVWNEGDKSVTYERYPVFVCCTELPEGMTPENLAGKQVSIDGFFYRIWKYDSEITKQAGMSGTVSPLIVASTPVVRDASTADLNRYVLIFILGTIALIGSVILYLRWSDRRDRTHAESLLDGLPEKIDTEGLD